MRIITNDNKRVKVTFNRSHEIGTKGKLITPPGEHVFDGSYLDRMSFSDLFY